MSLVFNGRKASVGPTPLGLSVAAYVSPQDNQKGIVGVPCFAGYVNRDFDGVAKKEIQQPWIDDEESSDSSSIGVPSDVGDKEDDEEEEEVESKFTGSLGSMGSLEESLPIKRGLSNHFSGKSKSFANLSDINSVKDVEKKEKPFNKRRRIMRAYKFSKKSSFYSSKNPISMPLLALNEEEEEEEQEEEEEETSSSKEEEGEENELQDRRIKQIKGLKSCFSLTDLCE